jgi:hypothetical protein
VRELTNWLSGGSDPDSFPYLPVLAEFHRTGKQFVAKELLALLDQIRATSVAPLHTFLDVALDKWDGRYDYQTYLALSLLPMPRAESTGDPAGERRHQDRLYLHLIADALAFELAAAGGTTGLLPRQRPEPALVAKRYRLGIRAAAPALRSRRQRRPRCTPSWSPARAPRSGGTCA